MLYGRRQLRKPVLKDGAVIKTYQYLDAEHEYPVLVEGILEFVLQRRHLNVSMRVPQAVALGVAWKELFSTIRLE